MVAQQLTPELTQPNVLVEIDPGPTMGPYQETQRCVPERYLSESMSFTSDASVSTLTFGPAVVSTAVEADGCHESSVGGGATALTGMGSHGTNVQVQEGGSVGHFKLCITFHRPSSTHCSKSGHTILDTVEKTALIGMHLNRFIEVDNKQGSEPSPMAETTSSRWSLPREGNRPLNSFEVAHAVVPSLPGKEKDWAKTTTARGCLQRGLAQDRLSSSGDPKSLLSLTDQGGTASRDCALENRHRSFNGDSNMDNEPVIHDKKIAGDDKPAVMRKSNNTVHPEIPTRNIRTRRFETQSTGQENTDDIELLSSMSCPNGAKTDVNVDAGCIASEILTWMIQYSLVSYSAS